MAKGKWWPERRGADGEGGKKKQRRRVALLQVSAWTDEGEDEESFADRLRERVGEVLPGARVEVWRSSGMREEM